MAMLATARADRLRKPDLNFIKPHTYDTPGLESTAEIKAIWSETEEVIREGWRNMARCYEDAVSRLSQ